MRSTNLLIEVLSMTGRDTTSTTLTWFFWLIASNPLVELKILEEIQTNFHDTEDKTCRFFNAEKSRKLVYLHGAFCETLRLFPPVALEHKSPVRPDILPSGHCIPQNTKIILFFYSMGRMERIWGKDCLEFKPERWISEHGRIKHEPSFKFPAFNAGPRTCIGKEMSFVLMKIVAATMIYNYHVQLVEGQSVSPCDSVIIQMKHGLKVKLSKRHAWYQYTRTIRICRCWMLWKKGTEKYWYFTWILLYNVKTKVQLPC